MPVVIKCFKEKLLYGITVLQLMKILEMYLKSHSFELLWKCDSSADSFDNNCQTKIWRTPFGGCFFKGFLSFQWSTHLRFLTHCSDNFENHSLVSSLNKFQQNNYLVPVLLICCIFNLLILISHRSKRRKPRATKMEIFVSTIHDSQLLTVVTKNFVLDATGVLDPRHRL